MPDSITPSDLSVSTDAAALLRARYGGDEIAPPEAWNAVLATLLGHRSTRAFLPDKLPADTLPTLVAAAQSAASSSNLQTWSVVAVQDPARKARLAVLAGSQKHIDQCPLFLLWLADLGRTKQIAADLGTEVSGPDYLEMMLVAAIDATLAAQNAVVALESMGLGSVYIGAIRNKPEEVAAELGLPPGVFAVFGLCVGVPDPAVTTDIKPRLSQATVLHHEQYDATTQHDAVAAYVTRLDAFQTLQNMPHADWRRTVMARVKNGAALMGRDRLVAALNALGFPLK